MISLELETHGFQMLLPPHDYVENTRNTSSAQRQEDLTDKISEGMKCDCSHNGWDFRGEERPGQTHME